MSAFMDATRELAALMASNGIRPIDGSYVVATTKAEDANQLDPPRTPGQWEAYDGTRVEGVLFAGFYPAPKV